MKSNLFIVGNGFDLACGLRSSYQDFFRSRMEEDVLKELEHFHKNYTAGNSKQSLNSIYFGSLKGPKRADFSKKDYEKSVNAKLSFWDVLFFIFDKNQGNKNWYDVENSIFSILNMIKLDEDYSDLGFKERPIPGVVRAGVRNKEKECFREALVLGYIVIPEDRFTNKQDIFDFLYSELLIFEADFTEYLIKEIDSQQGWYTTAVEDLLRTIVGSDILESNDYSVLSFNYTASPALRDAATNVHGTLMDRNIIFGIDQNAVGADTPLFRFTKTFRKMIQVIDPERNKTYINDKDRLKKIIFYGHSLGEADYSYFQSIFDYYDIYASDIQLEFCCSTYGDKTSEEVLSDMSILVGKLLSNYGPTMGNENRAKNILHKLMLENRLHIREIPRYR
ncbi:AbiH family protein [Enterococcus asini]|uniref:AbiH family protein n=1 Tax=Enterococcus asini TaxID=57732 RepID=UPI0032E3EE16